MRTRRAAVILSPLFALGACVHSAPPAATAPTRPVALASIEPIPTPAPIVSTAPRAAEDELPWINDDWLKSLGDAREAKHPIVVDFWATWCHYCTAAEGTTLRDPSILALKDRFVWARIDTDKPVNGDLLARLKVQGLPDYLVLDPADESIVGRWLGSATPEQFRNTLRDAERVYQAAHESALAENDPLRLVVEGHKASKKGDHAAAADFFARAVKTAPATWDRRDDTLDVLVMELAAAGKTREAIDVALAIPESDHSSSAADTLGSAADALGDLPPKTKDLGKLQKTFLERLTAMAQDQHAAIDTDVRVGLWNTLRGIHLARNEKKDARKCSEHALALLEDAAKRAPDPLAASAYNSGRARALLELDRANDAIAMLKKSEADLPNESDPPLRLARVYEQMHRYDDALVEIDKAISHASRRFAVELMLSRAKILSEMQRDPDVCATLAAMLADEQTLPNAQREPGLVDRARHQMSAAKCAMVSGSTEKTQQ
ncbi:MAG TPA: thioredoxin family protein [bacterium]|nr:thioredoxin family protein [bacterium]